MPPTIKHPLLAMSIYYSTRPLYFLKYQWSKLKTLWSGMRLRNAFMNALDISESKITSAKNVHEALEVMRFENDRLRDQREPTEEEIEKYWKKYIQNEDEKRDHTLWDAWDDEDNTLTLEQYTKLIRKSEKPWNHMIAMKSSMFMMNPDGSVTYM